jgi:hypothetical protein
MADIKISELTQVSALNNGDLVEVSQVNALAPSGYTSLKASMTDLGKKVNSDIEYTTDLADFTDKTITGAIKETAKGKNVADEYDGTQTYDKGDVVIYKNTLYICTTNNTTGTWDATKWAATTIDNVIGDLSSLTTSDKSSLVGAVNEVNGAKTNVFKGKITIGTVSAGTKYDLLTLSNFTGGLVPDFARMKGLMYLGGGGNANSYGYLFCNPITNLISYIPQVSDTNVSINIAVLY